MNINFNEMSTSARKKYLRYGKIPQRFALRESKLNISNKEIRRDLNLQIKSASQEYLWKKLELYGNYKNRTD